MTTSIKSRFAPPPVRVHVPPPAPPPVPGRNPVDVFERLRLPPREDLRDALQQLGYSRQLSGMSDEQLAAEIAKQEERQTESTTGADTNPEVAEDSKWRLEAAKAEQAKRELQNPELPLEDYAQRLTGLTDAQLAREEKRLNAAIDDARSGPHTNEADAAALEERLAAVKSERAQRVVDDPKAGLLEYVAATRGLSDTALTAEQQQVQAEYDALLAKMKEDPNPKTFAELGRLMPRLNALSSEVERRGLTTEPPPVEEPSTPEAEAPKSETYTVQEGDTLWAIAQRMSEQHGGTPSVDQVFADILALNDVPNPDLILADQQLQLPVYP